jgi:hypothetical protein
MINLKSKLKLFCIFFSYGSSMESFQEQKQSLLSSIQPQDIHNNQDEKFYIQWEKDEKEEFHNDFVKENESDEQYYDISKDLITSIKKNESFETKQKKDLRNSIEEIESNEWYPDFCNNYAIKLGFKSFNEYEDAIKLEIKNGNDNLGRGYDEFRKLKETHLWVKKLIPKVKKYLNIYYHMINKYDVQKKDELYRKDDIYSDKNFSIYYGIEKTVKKLKSRFKSLVNNQEGIGYFDRVSIYKDLRRDFKKFKTYFSDDKNIYIYLKHKMNRSELNKPIEMKKEPYQKLEFPNFAYSDFGEIELYRKQRINEISIWLNIYYDIEFNCDLPNYYGTKERINKITSILESLIYHQKDMESLDWQNIEQYLNRELKKIETDDKNLSIYSKIIQKMNKQKLNKPIQMNKKPYQKPQFPTFGYCLDFYKIEVYRRQRINQISIWLSVYNRMKTEYDFQRKNEIYKKNRFLVTSDDLSNYYRAKERINKIKSISESLIYDQQDMGYWARKNIDKYLTIESKKVETYFSDDRNIYIYLKIKQINRPEALMEKRIQMRKEPKITKEKYWFPNIVDGLARNLGFNNVQEFNDDIELEFRNLNNIISITEFSKFKKRDIYRKQAIPYILNWLIQHYNKENEYTKLYNKDYFDDSLYSNCMNGNLISYYSIKNRINKTEAILKSLIDDQDMDNSRREEIRNYLNNELEDINDLFSYENEIRVYLKIKRSEIRLKKNQMRKESDENQLDRVDEEYFDYLQRFKNDHLINDNLYVDLKPKQSLDPKRIQMIKEYEYIKKKMPKIYQWLITIADMKADWLMRIYNSEPEYEYDELYLEFDQSLETRQNLLNYNKIKREIKTAKSILNRFTTLNNLWLFNMKVQYNQLYIDVKNFYKTIHNSCFNEQEFQIYFKKRKQIEINKIKTKKQIEINKILHKKNDQEIYNIPDISQQENYSDMSSEDGDNHPNLREMMGRDYFDHYEYYSDDNNIEEKSNNIIDVEFSDISSENGDIGYILSEDGEDNEIKHEENPQEAQYEEIDYEKIAKERAYEYYNKTKQDLSIKNKKDPQGYPESKVEIILKEIKKTLGI